MSDRNARNRRRCPIALGVSDDQTGPPRRTGGITTDRVPSARETVSVAGYVVRGTSSASSSRLKVA